MMRKTSDPALFFYMLGTGGAFTDFRENYHNNAAIKTSDGWVLIDCGGTAMQSMKELGIKPWEVAGIIVTHMHGDHVGGIEHFIWENYYTGPTGWPGFRKTRIYTSLGIADSVQPMLEPCIGSFTGEDGTIWNDTSALVEYVDCEDDEHDKTVFEIGGVWFEFVPVDHVGSFDEDKESYGVIIRSGGAAVFYTSDIRFSADTLDAVLAGEPIDVVMHDCTFSPVYPGTVHTHYDQLLTLSPDVKRKVILMHHTKVPEGKDVMHDGFMWAADRQEAFAVSRNVTLVTSKSGVQTQIWGPNAGPNDTDENCYVWPGVATITNPTEPGLSVTFGDVSVEDDIS